MKIFTIDYTKISEAESSLYSATRLMANDCPDAALERIEEARQLLQEFLSQDNLVQSDDLADGLIMQSETFDDEQLDFIRDTMGEHIERYPKSSTAEDALAVINVCQKQLDCPEFESLEQFLNNTSNVWTEIKD